MAVENILPTADTATGTPNQSVSQSVPATAGAVTSEEAARLTASAKNPDPESQVQSALPTWEKSSTELNVSSDDAPPPEEVTGDPIPLNNTTTAASRNLDPGKNTSNFAAFKPIINPLHKYASYTYNLSLHILPADIYEKLMKDGSYTADGGRVLIASAGKYNDQTLSRNKYWREDFYFETLKMTTVLGMNPRSKGSNSIDLSFTIIEPYGISLLDRLIKTTTELGLPNYAAVPYLLQIDFVGSTGQDHTPATIKEAQRRFPIRLLTMTINFDQRGTVYNFTAVPFNHSAMQELILNLPTTTTIRTDANRTVGDFFSSTPGEISELRANIKPALADREEDFIRRAIAKGRSDQQDYQRKLPAFQKAEAESQARDIAASAARSRNSSGTPQVETKKSSIPPPPATVTRETALKDWERLSASRVIAPTSLNATGLASVLSAYNQFLKDEYGLVDSPVQYEFKIDDKIRLSTIDSEKLIRHELKPLTTVPAEKNPEVLNSNLRAAQTNLNQALNSGSKPTEAQLAPLRAAVAKAEAAIKPTTAQVTAKDDCAPPSSVSADTASAASANTPDVGVASSQQFASSAGTDVTFNQGTSILTVINDILKSSSYITEQLTTEIEQQLEKNSDADIKKIKSEFEPYHHFKIIPSVELGVYDPLRGDYAKKIIFTIKPYQMHGIRYPGIKQGTKPIDTECVKEYNYLYTGQNTDILDLKINFDTLYYTALSTKISRLQQSESSGGPGEEATAGSAGASDAASPSAIIAKQSKALPASLKFVPNVPGAMKLTQESIDAMRANDLFSNIYSKSAGDMLEIEMDIVGDPGYLQQEEFTISPERSFDEVDPADNRVNKDGSLIMTDRNLLVKLHFRFPIDIDTETGLYKFNDPLFRLADTNNTFTGIYRIVNIDNTFEHGVFKQKLKMIRVYNDTDSEKINRKVAEKLAPNTANSEQRPDTMDGPTSGLQVTGMLPSDTTVTKTRLDLSKTVFATTNGRAGDIDPASGNRIGAVTGMAKVGADGRSPAQQWQDRNAAAAAVKAAEAARIKAAERGREPGPDAPNYIGN